ncbi:MAG TPA: hypothetical protein VFJ45_07825 [bacterium]|nr:hypothetical protein [bacterium]
MALPPFRDHRIPPTDAAALTRRHREDRPQAHRGGMFHAKAVLDLLAQQGCAGLRYYFGRNADGTPTLVLVGVDSTGDDMATGTVLEWSFPCPPFCTASNDLSP